RAEQGAGAGVDRAPPRGAEVEARDWDGRCRADDERATYDVHQVSLVEFGQRPAGWALGERLPLRWAEARAELWILPCTDDGLCVHGFPPVVGALKGESPTGWSSHASFVIGCGPVGLGSPLSAGRA